MSSDSQNLSAPEPAESTAQLREQVRKSRKSKVDAPPAAPSEKAAAPARDPREDFIALVVNPGKGGSSRATVRTRGFVAVVRTAQSLEPLQAACASLPPDYRCVTLRYRVDSPQAFGTLFQAAVCDLAALLGGEAGDVLGSAQPGRDSLVWKGLREGPLYAFVAGRPRLSRGTLDTASIRDLFAALADPRTIIPGMRLVIFGEVMGADGDARGVAAWNQAAQMLFRHLPERVGLVLSGAPQGFVLPADPAHFLEIPELSGAPRAVDAEPDAGRSGTSFEPAELLADVPTAQDHLDRDAYAASLASFLLHPETAPPITIGLYGRWGTGKSSFWNLLRRRMQQDAGSQEANRFKLWKGPAIGFRNLFGQAALMKEARYAAAYRRRTFFFTEADLERLSERRLVTVSFNAWQYDDAKQTWAGLASTISDRLERALPPGRRQWMRLRYAWRTNRSDVLLNFGIPVLLLALAAVVLLPWLTPERVAEMAPEGAGNVNPLQGLLKSVLPAGSLLLLVWAVGWRLVEVLKPVSARVAGYLKRTDYRADMGYQHRVIDDLKFLLAELDAARPGCRVMVYIDDLDRCSDEKIVEILRATILILADCRLFVMFGMDTEMIRRAIVAHYEKMKVPLADPEAFAESYLRKIVQIALYLPETLPERRFSLVESMFSDAAREAYRQRGMAQGGTEPSGQAMGVLPFDLSSVRRPVPLETVEDTADELAALAELQEYLPDNARELKRFVNTHRFLKILLSASGSSWSGRRQRGLVRWLLFCARWPALVDDVLRYARTGHDAADCLAAASGRGWDDRARAFAAVGEPLSAADLLGDFALAARLSQVVHEESRPGPAAEAKEKVMVPGPILGT